jgi:hypothetical protein
MGTRRIAGLFHWCDSGVASRYDFAVAIAEEALAIGLLRSMPRIVPVGSGTTRLPRGAPAACSTLAAPRLRCKSRPQLADMRADWRFKPNSPGGTSMKRLLITGGAGFIGSNCRLEPPRGRPRGCARRPHTPATGQTEER